MIYSECARNDWKITGSSGSYVTWFIITVYAGTLHVRTLMIGQLMGSGKKVPFVCIQCSRG